MNHKRSFFAGAYASVYGFLGFAAGYIVTGKATEFVKKFVAYTIEQSNIYHS